MEKSFAQRSQEVKLTETRAERDLQDSLAEVFSIITTIDALEKAFLKDAIPEAEYTETCDRLLKQYKAILTDEAVAREFVDLETFKTEWEACLPISRDIVLSAGLIYIPRWKYREPLNAYGSASPQRSLPPLTILQPTRTIQADPMVL